MNKKDKNLVFKELCARLPYHVRVKVWLKVGTTEEGPLDLEHNYGDVLRNAFYYHDIVDIKPYLRLPSDLRKEEIDELFKILNISEDKGNWIKINDCTGIKFILPDGAWAENLIKVYDYFNSIHIDYRGLIEKNLAESVKKEFYE